MENDNDPVQIGLLMVQTDPSGIKVWITLQGKESKSAKLLAAN